MTTTGFIFFIGFVAGGACCLLFVLFMVGAKSDAKNGGYINEDGKVSYDDFKDYFKN